MKTIHIFITVLTLLIFTAGNHLLWGASPEKPMKFVADHENRFIFSAVQAKILRLELSRDAAGQAPALDEVLVFGPDIRSENIAASKHGTKVHVSSCISGYPIHRPEHINDEQYGNDYSWVADPADEEPSVQIEFPDVKTIDTVIFSRDQLGRFSDRVPVKVTLSYSLDGRTFHPLKQMTYSQRHSKVVRPRPPVVWADVFVPEIPAPPGASDDKSSGAFPLSIRLPKNWPTDDLGFENLALKPGAIARASSCISGYDIHKVEHLNDGQFGNEHSWIAQQNPCWAEIDLGETFTIYSVAFGSDSSGRFQDRGMSEYLILVATEYTAEFDTDSTSSKWKKVGPGKHAPNIQYRTEFRFEPIEARYVRICVEQSSYGMPARIDELEVFGRKGPISLDEIGPLNIAIAEKDNLETKKAKETTVDAEKLQAEWKTTLVDEEYAWLKTFGRADIDPGLTRTPYPIKKHPQRLPEDITTLVRIDTLPVLDGSLDDSCWQQVSRAIVRVASPGRFEESALVEYDCRAFLAGEMLYVGISTNRLLSSNLAVVQTSQSGGIIAVNPDGQIVWRVYDESKKANDSPLQGASAHVSQDGFTQFRCEFAIPLKQLPGIEDGLGLRTGIGGRYTPQDGHRVCFYPSTIAFAANDFNVDGFNIHLVNHGDYPCTINVESETVILDDKQTTMFAFTKMGEIGPERNISLTIAEQNFQGRLHLFHYDPLERVLRQLSEMLDRVPSTPQAKEAAKRLAELREQKQNLPKNHYLAESYRNLFYTARKVKRELFFSDPAMEEIETILFEKRYPLHPSHNYSDYYDSTWREGGGIYTLKIPKENGRFVPEKAILTELFATTGMCRHPVADFDVSKIYFTNRPSQSDFWHIMEMNPDGTGLRQITDGPFQDLWPCPLPDGDLAFISTRCKQKFLCWEPQASVLHRMDKNGENIKRLSFANLTEFAPSTTRDGRILWTRSEYLDKGADYGHTLWYVHPDGAVPELTFGNTIVLPQGYANGREIPDSTEICAVMISHFGDLNGPVAILDIDKGRLNPDAIESITPEVPWPGYWARCETFREPFPISKNLFLVSHSPRDRFGLFVIDRFGNREMLYMDTETPLGCMCPTPLRSRPTPLVLSSSIEPELARENMGVFTLEDVYMGIDHAVQRGSAKYLRVCQEMPHFLEKNKDGTYRSSYTPFMEFYASPVDLVSGPFGWTSYVAKGDLGTVEIEKDGSASFFAPAESVLFFELLDENYNEIQRMRSVVQLMPGEMRSCVGCHEERTMTPTNRRTTLASRQAPKRLTPSPWGAGPFDYQKVVQPVLDAKCVSCHNAEKPNKADLSGTLDKDFIPSSFKTLIRGGYVHHFHWGWNEGIPTKAEPLTFGSVKSRIWPILDDENHKPIKLTLEEERAIKCWIDLSCPLWPDYKQRSRRNDATAHDGTCVQP